MFGFDPSILWLLVPAVIFVAAPLLIIRSNEKRFWFLALIPTLWFLLFYGLVARVCLVYGYWPSPGHPDPYFFSPTFTWHHVAIWASFPTVVIGAIALILFTILHCRSHFWQARHRVGIIVFAVAFGGWWFNVLADPGSFIVWFLD